MALSEVSQNTTKSNDILKTNREEQLNSTSKVFCEACNQIAKDYFVNYNEANLFLPISIPFAKKVIEKTKISFSQLVVTLVYLNRYFKFCVLLNKHIPGHKEAVIPSLSHIIIICIIQAERYVNDTPHKLSWWAEICAGQTKTSDINKWQREFFNILNYNLYVHPEKDYNVFKAEIRRLAARVLRNSATMPQEFRHSVNLGTPINQNSVPSSHSNCILSQPNIIHKEISASVPQPRSLLSPIYSHINTITIHSSPQTSNSDESVLNITDTKLINSPIGIEKSMINQIRSPSSIYINSNQISFNNNTDSNMNHLKSNTLLPLIQYPNKPLFQSISHCQYPNKNLNYFPLSSKDIDESLTDTEKQKINKNNIIFPKPTKRKGYYGVSCLSKINQDLIKKPKIIMTISPEELYD